MKRFARIITVLLVVIGLVAAACVLAIFLLPETDLVRTNVQDQLTQLSGQKVSIGSIKVSLAFPKLAHLNLEGISVQTPEGAELFAADRIVLSPSLGGLLTRRLDIESVVVERFRTSIVRAEDGTIRNPFLPVALPRHPGESKPEAAPASGQSRLKVPPAPATTPPPPVNWSLRRFQLADGRVDWVDRSVTPGKEVLISIAGLSADLTQPDSAGPVSVKVRGKLAASDQRGSEVLIEGSVTASPDRTSLERVVLSLSSDPLDLQTFRGYVPERVSEGGILDPVAVTARCAWQRGEASAVDLSLSAKQKAEPAAQIALEGKLALPTDSNPQGAIAFAARSDGLPLKLFRSMLPQSVPLETAQGVVKGALQGNWVDPGHWNVNGKLALENAEPRAPYRTIGKPIRAVIEADLNPAELSINEAEITGYAKVAAAKGRIRKPLDENPEFDLTGDVLATPELARAFGLKIPEGLHIDGGVPVRGRVFGGVDKVSFDVTGDLTGTRVAFAAFVDKPRGQKGNVAAKGTVQAPVNRAGALKFDASVAVNAAGVAVGTAGGSGLTGLVLSAQSKVVGRGVKIDLKDAAIKVKRSAQAPDLLAATGIATDVGSPDPTVKAAVTATLDNELLKALGLPSTGDVTIKGAVPISTQVNGALSALTWTVDAPLTAVELGVKDFFRKPAGVQSAVHASLRSVGREVKLASSRLNLAGASFSGHGVLSDRQGKFGEVSFETKGARIERLLALLPKHKGLPLSGPVDATARLAGTDHGIGQTASIRLAGLSFRPDGAQLALDQMTGTIDVNGDSVEIPQISGRIIGMIQAPVAVKGSLKQVGSLAMMNGTLSVDAGKGRIKAESVLGWISQARALARGIVAPQAVGTKGDFRDFNYLKGDVTIASGAAASDNIRLKGADISLGAMGSVRLDTEHLKDTLVAVRTDLSEVQALGEALGQIGPVRELIERHRGLLDAVGIKLPQKREAGERGVIPAQALQTVIMRLNGPISNPQKAIVLEASLNKETAARLKNLLE